MMRFLLGLLMLLLPTMAYASNCPALPYTLLNGTVADASQVMANFNSLETCVNNSLITNGFTQGKILAGTGPGTFQYRYETTGVNILDFGPTTTCNGVTDDSAALNAAVATQQTVYLPAGGICNLNTTQAGTPPFVTQLATPGQCIMGQPAGVNRSVIQSTLTNSVLIEMAADGNCVQYISFVLGTMNDGFVVYAMNGKNQRVQNNLFTMAPGLLAMNGARAAYFADNYGTGIVGGTPTLLSATAGSTKAAVFDFDIANAPGLRVLNNIFGMNGAGYMFLMDGNTNSADFVNTQINIPGECLHVQDSANVGLMNFIYAFNFQCQTPSGRAGFDFLPSATAGGGFEYVFIGSFCNKATSYCAFISKSTNRVEFQNVNFNGCGLACIYADGMNLMVGPGIVSNAGGNGGTSCALFASNLCPAIGIGPDSVSSFITNIVTQANPTTHPEEYGVDVMNGARQVILSGNNFDGNTVLGGWHIEAGANTCGSTLANTVLVLDDGRCPIESDNGAIGNASLPASSIVNPVPGAMVHLWRHGPIGAFTDTTDTAANIIAAMTNPQVGQTWLLDYVVALGTGGNATLAGGTGVTIAGPAMIPVNNGRTFLCRLTGTTGSAPTAVTCTGQ